MLALDEVKVMLYKKFNIRQKQAYAAICLWVFCAHLKIHHDSITKLLTHLVNMLTADSLPKWEQEGLDLEIVGRGEPLPSNVKAVVPKEHLEVFSSFIESCIEVGIVDMYGESTELPSQFLEECVNVLKAFEISIPSPEVLARFETGGDSWGETISKSELSETLTAYEIVLR